MKKEPQTKRDGLECVFSLPESKCEKDYTAIELECSIHQNKTHICSNKKQDVYRSLD